MRMGGWAGAPTAGNWTEEEPLRRSRPPECCRLRLALQALGVGWGLHKCNLEHQGLCPAGTWDPSWAACAAAWGSQRRRGGSCRPQS